MACVQCASAAWPVSSPPNSRSRSVRVERCHAPSPVCPHSSAQCPVSVRAPPPHWTCLASLPPLPSHSEPEPELEPGSTGHSAHSAGHRSEVLLSARIDNTIWEDTEIKKENVNNVKNINIQVRLHLNVKLFNGIRMTGFVAGPFCII